MEHPLDRSKHEESLEQAKLRLTASLDPIESTNSPCLKTVRTAHLDALPRRWAVPSKPINWKPKSSTIRPKFVIFGGETDRQIFHFWQNLLRDIKKTCN